MNAQLLFNANSLSTGWKGTCALANQYDTFYNNYISEINSLKEVYKKKNNELLSYFALTDLIIGQLFDAKNITSKRPSQETGELMPNFEREFTDKTNKHLFGG